MGQLATAISSGLWRTNIPDHKGTALWAIPAGRVCTGSSIAWANWWPAVTIYLVCTHPVCPWGQSKKQEGFFLPTFHSMPATKKEGFQFSALFLRLCRCFLDSGLPCYRHPQEASQQTHSLRSLAWTYHCDTDHQLQSLASLIPLMWWKHT